jgi:WS/DGAT/MGAT family acyltransferase
VRQLTSLDAQFLRMEDARTYGHVSGLAVYDPSTAPGGELRLEDVCRLVGERLHLLPVFRWRLAEVPFRLDLPYWVEDPDFHIDFHVRESAVPPPGDDGRLAEVVARIFARPLDRHRPLWELYLIHGLSEGRVALFTKIHHSVADGMSGQEVLSALLDPSPEGRELAPPPPEAHGGRVPGELEMLGRGLLGVPRQPLRALRSVPDAVPNLTELPGANAIPGVPTLNAGLGRLRRLLGSGEDPELLEVTTARAPRTFFNGPISQHRRVAIGRLSLDTVKAIKASAGVTVNDVVVALCAGALRGWLLDRHELPDDPLVAMIPVSVRTEEERSTFGNRVSIFTVPLATDEPDPGRRLARTHELLREAKLHHKALPADLLTEASDFIPPAMMALAARTTMGVLGRTRPPLNVVISNVPGPREPLFCALDFGLVGDRDQIDDLWPLMRRLSGELDELEVALCGPRAAERSGDRADEPVRSGDG